MMKYRLFHPSWLCLLAGLGLMRCSLDEGNPGTNGPALQLQVQQELSLLNLSWAPLKVTGFKEYVILQSSGDIPDAPTPVVSTEVTVLTRINEVNVTSFSTTNILLTPTTCFKLYGHVDDRFLYSGTVCLNQTLTTLPAFYDKADHEVDNPDIAMFDRLNFQLTSYSFDEDIVTHSIQENLLSFPILDLSGYEGTNRLYAFDQGSNVVRKYTFPELVFQNQKTFSEAIFGGVAAGPFVYVSTQSSTNAFQILSANTLSLIDSKQGIQNSRNLAVFEGDPTIVLEIGDAFINRYQINNVGKVTQTDKLLTGVNQVGIQNSCDFNSTYFVGGRFCTLVNKDGELVTSLVNGQNVFCQFCRFSPDGTKAVAIVSDNNSNTLQLFDISALPASLKLKSYVLPIATFSDLFINDGVIHIVGVNFNSSEPITFFLKFPM